MTRERITGIIAFALFFTLFLPSNGIAYSDVCPPERLSTRGKLLLEFGSLYTKRGGNFLACRLGNGGLLWALDLRHCEVKRMRERPVKTSKRRTLGIHGLPRKTTYVIRIPKIVICSSIGVKRK